MRPPLLALLLLAATARADVGGREVGQTLLPIKNGASTYNCTSIDMSSADFTVSSSGSTCLLNVAGAIGRQGTCVGDTASDWCGSGTGPAWLMLPYRPGGSGVDGAFTYNGESSCSGNVCRGGTCAGSTCTLTINSPIFKLYNGPSSFAVENYSSFTLQSGTVTVAAPSIQGGGAVIYVSGDVTITGGTITMQSLGSTAGGSGTATCSAVGKAGGNNALNIGGSAGTASGTSCASNACDGTSVVANLDRVLYRWHRDVFLLGTGGGSQLTIGTSTLNGPAGFSLVGIAYGGNGGGSGGCTSGCTTTTAGAGGRGGGFLHLEVGGTYSCAGATITANGTAGGNGTGPGGGGGGGGGIHIMYGTLGTNTCTPTATGGAGGTGAGNCGAGGVGGNGSAVVEQLGR